MIVSPSIILLQPHVGGFHASDQEKIAFSSQLQDTFGHLLQPHVGGFHASDQEKIAFSSQLQDTFGHQVGV